MAQLSPSDGQKTRQFDPLAVSAAIFFALALLFGAYPAFRAGAANMGGFLLLLGLAGVAFFTILAFRSAGARGGDDLGAEAMIDALSEPSVLAAPDGRILNANTAWEATVGAGGRLPRAVESGGLFAAIAAARRGEAGVVEFSVGGVSRRATVGAAGPRRFLVRLIEAAPSPAPGVVADPALPGLVVSQDARSAPIALNAFAAAAPFGAALLHGEDPLSATISHVNETFLAMVGARDPTDLRLADLIEPASWAEASVRIADRRHGPVEVRLAHAPERIAHLYLTRGGDGFVAYLIDVSEQKQVELELAQSQKIQAIGQLAGGVAHDFNNLLTAIQLRLDELLHRHPVGDPSYEGLNEIRQTGVRAADLVRKLLAFSRKQTVQRETLELGELISEFEVLLRRLLREDVKLETDYGRNLPLVRADKSQLETAVMNLTVNARDAVHAQYEALKAPPRRP